MKNTDRIFADGNKLTVADHDAWRHSLLTPADYDEIDAALDEHLQFDPHITGTNNRRSDRELARMLDLIDNLPISTTGEEGQA